MVSQSAYSRVICAGNRAGRAGAASAGWVCTLWNDYAGGISWHPHRGIETITYVLAGSVEHGDSLGNKGKMTAGDVQWMTAGSGILHEEMSKGDSRGRMHGFELWASLPANLKMTDPRYQDIPASAIPEKPMTTKPESG